MKDRLTIGAEAPATIRRLGRGGPADPSRPPAGRPIVRRRVPDSTEHMNAAWPLQGAAGGIRCRTAP